MLGTKARMSDAVTAFNCSYWLACFQLVLFITVAPDVVAPYLPLITVKGTLHTEVFFWMKINRLRLLVAQGAFISKKIETFFFPTTQFKLVTSRLKKTVMIIGQSD